MSISNLNQLIFNQTFCSFSLQTGVEWWEWFLLSWLVMFSCDDEGRREDAEEKSWLPFDPTPPPGKLWKENDEWGEKEEEWFCPSSERGGEGGETLWRQVEVFARGHRPKQSDHCMIKLERIKYHFLQNCFSWYNLKDRLWTMSCWLLHQRYSVKPC